jgi:hypothetical protein
MKAQLVQKQITFPTQLYELVLKRVESLGVSFSEYMRSLAISDIKIKDHEEDIPMVDAGVEKQIGKSLEDIKKGRYHVLNTSEDISNHFNNL